jgi:hypothetical protein
VLTENEHNFLKEICLNALSADKNVGFVAVIDNNGKLLAAEFNKLGFFKNSNTLIKSSIFYSHYLIPAIRQQQEEVLFTSAIHNNNNNNNNNIFYCNVVDLGSTVYLAVIALTEKKDRYVCIYLKSKPETTLKTKSQHELIISKIIAALRLFFLYLEASTKCNEYRQ